MEKKRRIGRYLRSSVAAGEYYDSYIPKPLPPEPPLDMRGLYPLLDQVNVALGRLDRKSILIFSTGAPNRFLSLLSMWSLFAGVIFKCGGYSCKISQNLKMAVIETHGSG